jgi:hypothetical protein
MRNRTGVRRRKSVKGIRACRLRIAGYDVDVAVRLHLPAIAALLIAGAAAFACASPEIPEDEVETPLPDRVASSPKADATTADTAIVPTPPPRDASPEQEAAPVDAFRLLHVFVSSAVVNGGLGGIAGADLKCTSLATAQGLKGTYRAWLSVAGTNAADRITSAGPWHLVNGQIVANTHAELVSGTLLRPINVDEKGNTPPAAEDRVWTGTGPNGVFSGPECGVWSGAGSARVGEAEFKDGRWTNSTVEDCGQVNRVYCFEL